MNQEYSRNVKGHLLGILGSLCSYYIPTIFLMFPNWGPHHKRPVVSIRQRLIAY